MARGDGEDLYDYREKLRIIAVSRGLSPDRVADWYRRWCEKTGWKGHSWPPDALKALAIRLEPPTLEEQILYLKKTARRCE